MFEQSYKSTKKDELPLFGVEFVKNLQFLKMASHYIGNYDNYRDKLTEIISKDSSIEKAINKIYKAEEDAENDIDKSTISNRFEKLLSVNPDNYNLPEFVFPDLS